MIDYKELLFRYMEHLIDYEGSTFLRYSAILTKDELKELMEIEVMVLEQRNKNIS